MSVPFLAGFAEVEITPEAFPIRTYRSAADGSLDPLYARAAAFQCGDTALAMVSLDVVIVEAPVVARIRELAAGLCAIPKGDILVCATHNHACPAVIDRPGFPKEEGYVAYMAERAAEAVAQAFTDRQPASVSMRSGLEHRASFNRRFITRDGCVVTQPQGVDLERVLCNENVVDPEVGVLRVSSEAEDVLGVIVNFGCHAVHTMGRVSAGYPGVLCSRIKAAAGARCGTVFLNGPCANVFHRDFLNTHVPDTAERTGGLLADTVEALLDDMPAPCAPRLGVRSTRLRIPYRDFEEAERLFGDPDVRRNVFQSLISDGWYDYASLKRMAAANGGSEEVEIQAIRIGDAVFAAIPAEYFMEHGLRIKELSPSAHTYVVSLANGWVGYIPTRAAFERKGGHETTAALWSKMCRDAGDRMADAALQLIRELV